MLTPVFQHFKLMLEFSPLKLLRESTCDISSHQICGDFSQQQNEAMYLDFFFPQDKLIGIHLDDHVYVRISR